MLMGDQSASVEACEADLTALAVQPFEALTPGFAEVTGPSHPLKCDKHPCRS